ncbi:YozD family protein [Bacillus sp. Marseille-P3661]|uniref:YozD family protein n=1 Tax=Bacillus sp. Marseille-P3661 TaxID=1936234 RepID=UPI000C82FBB3|nr:YozD family protein [Bacillus sp. Marseille-P3661]
MKNIVIDSDEIANFFYERLIDSGYIPTEEETLVIADITFDYLLSIGLIEELDGDQE